jgi:hypothetical protein
MLCPPGPVRPSTRPCQKVRRRHHHVIERGPHTTGHDCCCRDRHPPLHPSRGRRGRFRSVQFTILWFTPRVTIDVLGSAVRTLLTSSAFSSHLSKMSTVFDTLGERSNFSAGRGACDNKPGQVAFLWRSRASSGGKFEHCRVRSTPGRPNRTAPTMRARPSRFCKMCWSNRYSFPEPLKVGRLVGKPFG